MYRIVKCISSKITTSNLSMAHTTQLSTPGGDRGFEKAAVCLWNCTPVSLRNTDSLESFKSGLKQYLYTITYT